MQQHSIKANKINSIVMAVNDKTLFVQALQWHLFKTA
jgi:hypothetical protein